MYLRAWRYVHLLSYWFVSHCFIQFYAQKKKKQKQKQKNKKKTKKKTKKKQRKKTKKNQRKKKRKEKIYINKCARICIQYKYSLSSYVDL